MKKAVDVVLQYFEETPLPAAEVVLHMVTVIINKRQPAATVAKTRKLSAESRERIAEGQRKRHAAAREESESPKRETRAAKRNSGNSAPFEHSEETKEALA